ncbi:GIY-YIG nuclease family protein [Hydrogenophaga sp.]|uniref:GIY-YIG nuclease family protein n=1 Tax=Hydrogenophaga sp. TaxID=1904254 RepID=UPI00271966C8|nr:GIY-YIG nuclease family protein [Hydrogenophaga sp.]MDO9134244.1 GIY-YIG nuclease family protein [Hydrogenophaga sp.]
MPEETPIREYEQAVYIYWFGPQLPTVKIGHSNDPHKRLAQLGNDTGVPDHLAGFAAIVWIDRKREKVEALAHELAADYRRTGEWFELSAKAALEYVIEAARLLGIRYEVEDLTGIHEYLPKTFFEAREQYLDAKEKVKEAKLNLHEAERDLECFGPVVDADDEEEQVRLKSVIRTAEASLKIASLRQDRIRRVYDALLEEYKETPEYAQEQKQELERSRLAKERARVAEEDFNKRAVAFWNEKWAKESK